MAEKRSVRVYVGGRVVTLSGYESEEYLQSVGGYLDRKYGEMAETPGFSHLKPEQTGMLLAINVADDYFRAKNKVTLLEEELAASEKKLFALNQELIALKKKK